MTTKRYKIHGADQPGDPQASAILVKLKTDVELDGSNVVGCSIYSLGSWGSCGYCVALTNLAA